MRRKSNLHFIRCCVQFVDPAIHFQISRTIRTTLISLEVMVVKYNSVIIKPRTLCLDMLLEILLEIFTITVVTLILQ